MRGMMRGQFGLKTLFGLTLFVGAYLAAWRFLSDDSRGGVLLVTAIGLAIFGVLICLDRPLGQ